MKPLEGARMLLWAEQADVQAVVREAVSRLGCQLRPVDSFEQVQEALESEPFDLILAHLCGCCASRLELLPRLARLEPPRPVLIIVDDWDKDLYLEALKRGAFDGVALPLNEKEFIRIASRALEARSMRLAVRGGAS